MNYNELLKQPQWLSKRQEILNRDFHRCRNCSAKQGLQVHHRQYHLKADGSKVAPWSYESKYLITLCEKCHSEGHAKFKIPFYPIEEQLTVEKTNSTTKINSQTPITQI